MSDFIACPIKKLYGSILVPGDKSISHRSVMLGSIADGISVVDGFLQGDDAIATLTAFSDMGVVIYRNGDRLEINGVGLYGLKRPKKPLNLGNSGTSMRLMSGILSAQNFTSELVGDKSLSSRPMGRIIKPLSAMGANISGKEDKPPLKIIGTKNLNAINYQMPIASAQVKSSLLLAAIYAQGKTTITEKCPSRDHTERMLGSFGYCITTNGGKISITGGAKLKATKIKVPADISSAAFFIVAASITSNANILLKLVNINPTRSGVIDILKLMGADIIISNKKEVSGEPVADIMVRATKLNGITIPKNLIPLAIDEFPAIFIAAACAKGKTILTNASELKVKESNRIKVMADGLNILGIKTKILDDGIIIYGGNFRKPTATINSYGDHRVAMAFAISSVKCDYDIKIADCNNVKTSLPNFIELASKIGMNIQQVN